ncbi:hypothetical protein [Enterobacter intestinihominis]
MSRKTGYKWLQRFDPSDLSSLSDRSRAAPSHSPTVSDYIAGQLTALRQKPFSYKNIRAHDKVNIIWFAVFFVK